VQMRIRLWR